MTEVVAKARDWLGELQALIAADEMDAFQALTREALEARLDLEDKVFAMAAEYTASPKKEKADFFYPALLPKDAPAVQAQPKPAPETDWAAERARREKALVALAAPKSEPEEAKAQPEPEQSKVQLPAVVPLRPKALAADQQLEALNAEHAVIMNLGGKTVIASWDPSSFDPQKLEWVFQNKESFLLRYSNRFAFVDGRRWGSSSMPLGQWWLTHPDRRQFRGVTFMPGASGTVGECLNLWRGWGVDPVEGDWSLIREHIEDVIAGGNVEFAEYVMRWIAWAIQHPDRQAEVALVLIGEKGTGKGTLVRALERLFGAHAFQVNSREAVIGQFNGHLQDCILFVADEAYWGGDKRCVGRLQGMITEPTLSIERKGIDLFTVRNLLHVVMLAEPGWVIPAGRYERRYAALAVSDKRRGDKPYFKALYRQIDEGGVAAMFYDLQKMDLGDWHPREIPDALLRNAALQKQQRLTLPPLEQWYFGLLHNGMLPGIWNGYPSRAYTKDLLEDARENYPRLKWDLSEVALANFLKDEVDCELKRSGKCNGWSFPPLEEARKAWVKRYGPTDWRCSAIEWGGKPKPKAEAAQPAALVVPFIRRL
jgi:Family of unknown function (DUF5906)